MLDGSRRSAHALLCRFVSNQGAVPDNRIIRTAAGGVSVAPERAPMCPLSLSPPRCSAGQVARVSGPHGSPAARCTARLLLLASATSCRGRMAGFTQLKPVIQKCLQHFQTCTKQVHVWGGKGDAPSYALPTFSWIFFLIFVRFFYPLRENERKLR